GEDDLVGAVDFVRGGEDLGGDADGFEGLLDGAEVGHSVVDDGNGVGHGRCVVAVDARVRGMIRGEWGKSNGRFDAWMSGFYISLSVGVNAMASKMSKKSAKVAKRAVGEQSGA